MLKDMHTMWQCGLIELHCAWAAVRLHRHQAPPTVGALSRLAMAAPRRPALAMAASARRAAAPLHRSTELAVSLQYNTLVRQISSCLG
jgi:hypothetical protein